MAYNFPASPSNGDTYVPAGGPSWLFNGTGWVVSSSSSGLTIYWDDITDKPDEFPPELPIEHTDVTGLGTAAVRNISVGTSAPSSPSTNDIWIDTT